MKTLKGSSAQMATSCLPSKLTAFEKQFTMASIGMLSYAISSILIASRMKNVGIGFFSSIASISPQTDDVLHLFFDDFIRPWSMGCNLESSWVVKT